MTMMMDSSSSSTIPLFPSSQDNQMSSPPTYFVCPISLQVMNDPVTVSTGITYERENIERWILDCEKRTCPMTMQVLENQDLTPNHTLKRLIQSWMTTTGSSSSSTSASHTDFNAFSPQQIKEILEDLRKCNSPSIKIVPMRNLKALMGTHRHKDLFHQFVSLESLVSFIDLQEMEGGCHDAKIVCELVLEIISKLQQDQTTITQDTSSLEAVAAKLVRPAAWILKRGTCGARFHVASVLRNIILSSCRKAREDVIANATQDLIEGLVELVADENTSSGIEVLCAICSNNKRNRVIAIEAGALYATLGLLAEPQQRRRVCEKLILLLDILCECPEGRAVALGHALTVAVVSKKILRVSHFVTEKGVRILWSLCKFSPNGILLSEMAQCGAVSKLCMVLQMECSLKAKHKAKEVLRLHANRWRNCQCVPSNMIHPSF